MAEYSLNTPLKDEDLKKLKAGDTVKLTGTVYTARDAAHKRLVDLLEAGDTLPLPIEGQVIYYVGPAPTPPGKAIGSAGPTTSYRMDPYSPPLIENGLNALFISVNYALLQIFLDVFRGFFLLRLLGLHVLVMGHEFGQGIKGHFS